MVLSSHAGHKLGNASQSFLHFFFFFLHLVPLVDLHVSNSVSQSALQSAKTSHGGGEATGAEGAGGGEATGEGGRSKFGVPKRSVQAARRARTHAGGRDARLN